MKQSLNLNQVMINNESINERERKKPCLPLCLVEDVLSKTISKLISESRLDLIKSSKNNFYVDDILIFCNGKMSNIYALKKFIQYSIALGQVFNFSKSFIYSSVISIICIICFTKGNIHFNYLGVPIFRGRVKAIYLQSLIDKIISKLTTWK